MQERYGIDLDEPGLLDRRSGRWLQARIMGLLSVPYRYVMTEAGPVSRPTTRLQSALDSGRE